MDIDFSGINVLVGGATDGIGWACSTMFADRGANVIMLARNKEKLNERLKSLSKSDKQKHFILPVDYSNIDQLYENLMSFISKEKITFNIIVNNTGGPPGGKLSEALTDELQFAFNLHLLAFHKILLACLSGMKSNEYGRIINIISTSVKQPLDGLGVSNTIRGAVANWSKTLANELGVYNITVNNVLPGATNTNRLKEIIQKKSTKLNLSEEELQKKMEGEVPLRRIANPNEVADAVLFLASKKASYINGVNLPVDGGRTKSL